MISEVHGFSWDSVFIWIGKVSEENEKNTALLGPPQSWEMTGENSFGWTIFILH